MKLLLPAGIAVAAAAAIAATATGQTAPAPAPAALPKLVQKEDHFQFVDVAPKGGVRKPPSSGDEYVIGARLLASGKAVGTSNLVCTVTRPGGKGLSVCTGALVLAGGSIDFGGISRLATDGDTFPITGGTGSYAKATGAVVGTQGAGDTTDITVQLG